MKSPEIWGVGRRLSTRASPSLKFVADFTRANGRCSGGVELLWLTDFEWPRDALSAVARIFR
jgi:hypothetical protein